MSHFLNKVGGLLGFDKIPNSSTIAIRIAKYLLFSNKNINYLVIFN